MLEATKQHIDERKDLHLADQRLLDASQPLQAPFHSLDLNAEAVNRMGGNGLLPAALIETSPANYQAWIKLSEKPISAELRKALAQEFARQYGADPASADAQHYGRLAGFTNQKAQHARNGRQPYVLAHASPGQVAARAPEALQSGERMLSGGG